MKQHKRNSVFVAPSNTVGHELVFKHFTSNVVVAKYPDTNTGQLKETKKGNGNKMRAAKKLKGNK